MSADWMLNWPDHIERTPEEQRERTKKFDSGFRKTEGDVGDEMDRLGADVYRIDHISGSGGDPGVVVRWQVDGTDYVIAADQYETKSSNLREAFLWLKETRKRADRKVSTGRDEFAAARLPSGDEDASPVVAEEPPHEVLGVDRDASDEEVQAAFRERIKEVHPDPNTAEDADNDEVIRVKKAREKMLNR